MQQQKYTGKVLAALAVTTALLITSCCLAPTQARYENNPQWRGVYTPQKRTITSDRLISGGQTILLNDWSMESNVARMEAITFFGDANAELATVRCASDHPEYITPTLDRNQLTADANGTQVHITLTPTEAALALTEPVTVTVQVELLPESEAEPTIWAVYQMKLVSPGEEIQTEPTESEATESTEPEQTETTESQETESTEPEETEPQVTEPEETEPQQTEPEETQSQEIESQELEAQETEPAETELAELTLQCADSMAWSERLAMKIALPAQTDTLVLTMDGADFPEGTRYIYGQKAFFLGSEMPITINPEGQEDISLLLDFSLVAPPQTETVSLQAQTFCQQELTGESACTIATTREAFWVDLAKLNPVLTGKKSLSIPLCQDTIGLTWRLEMLTQTEEGVTYTQSDEQYYLVLTISEESGETGSEKFINISNASGKAPAGTYRLVLERLQNEQIINSAQIPFYICY